MNPPHEIDAVFNSSGWLRNVNDITIYGIIEVWALPGVLDFFVSEGAAAPLISLVHDCNCTAEPVHQREGERGPRGLLLFVICSCPQFTQARVTTVDAECHDLLLPTTDVQSQSVEMLRFSNSTQ